jgi:hypothetical protein
MIQVGEHFLQFFKAFALGYVLRKVVKPSHKKTVIVFKIGRFQFHYVLPNMNIYLRIQARKMVKAAPR